MRPLTHDQARRLVHAAADRSLTARDGRRLEAHLAACPDCRAYQAEIARLQSIVTHALRERWSERKAARRRVDGASAQAAGAIRRGRFFRAANGFTQIASLFVIAVMLVRWAQVWDAPASVGRVEAPAAARAARSLPAAPTGRQAAAIPVVEFEPDQEDPAVHEPPAGQFDPADTWFIGDRVIAR